jgi:phosphoesterase RecJ-like protein
MTGKIKEVLEEKKRFLITTHVDPDGDAIGSVFAMYFFLKKMGKSPKVYLKDAIPYRYAFLPRPEEIENGLGMEYEGILVLDCGDLRRVGEGYEILQGHDLIVNIDHHETNEMFGKINYVSYGASSTAEILYDIFKSFENGFTYEVAINLYTGILTDTGSFRFENTNERAFKICAEMLSYGVSPRFVAEMVYENHPKERFFLLSEVLKTLEIEEGGKLGIASVTTEMLKKTRSTYEHSDGFVEYLKELKGVKVVVLLRELESGRCKVSMRSKNDIDVGRVCQRFGGGGHKNAAGCIVNGKLEDVKELIKRAVSEVL